MSTSQPKLAQLKKLEHLCANRIDIYPASFVTFLMTGRRLEATRLSDEGVSCYGCT